MEIQKKCKSNLRKLYASLWSLYLVLASFHSWYMVFNSVLQDRRLPKSQAIENLSLT